MGDEEQGHARLVLDAPEQVQNLGADGDVQGGHGFVGDDEFGAQGQGAGDADALALAAGELVRVARQGGRRQADLLEQAGDFGAHLAGRDDVMRPQRLFQDRPDGHARVERGEGVLEDDLHPGAQAAQGLRVQRKHVLAVKEDLPRRRLGQAQKAAAQGGLAAAGLPDQAQRLPGVQGQVHAVHGAQGFGDAPQRPVLRVIG